MWFPWWQHYSSPWAPQNGPNTKKRVDDLNKLLPTTVFYSICPQRSAFQLNTSKYNTKNKKLWMDACCGSTTSTMVWVFLYVSPESCEGGEIPAVVPFCPPLCGYMSHLQTIILGAGCAGVAVKSCWTKSSPNKVQLNSSWIEKLPVKKTSTGWIKKLQLQPLKSYRSIGKTIFTGW